MVLETLGLIVWVYERWPFRASPGCFSLAGKWRPTRKNLFTCSSSYCRLQTFLKKFLLEKLKGSTGTSSAFLIKVYLTPPPPNICIPKFLKSWWHGPACFLKTSFVEGTWTGDLNKHPKLQKQSYSGRRAACKEYPSLPMYRFRYLPRNILGNGSSAHINDSLSISLCHGSKGFCSRGQ